MGLLPGKAWEAGRRAGEALKPFFSKSGDHPHTVSGTCVYTRALVVRGSAHAWGAGAPRPLTMLTMLLSRSRVPAALLAAAPPAFLAAAAAVVLAILCALVTLRAIVAPGVDELCRASAYLALGAAAGPGVADITAAPAAVSGHQAARQAGSRGAEQLAAVVAVACARACPTGAGLQAAGAITLQRVCTQRAHVRLRIARERPTFRTGARHQQAQADEKNEARRTHLGCALWGARHLEGGGVGGGGLHRNVRGGKAVRVRGARRHASSAAPESMNHQGIG